MPQAECRMVRRYQSATWVLGPGWQMRWIAANNTKWAGEGPERGAGHSASSTGQTPDIRAANQRSPGKPNSRDAADTGTGEVRSFTRAAPFSAEPRYAWWTMRGWPSTRALSTR